MTRDAIAADEVLRKAHAVGQYYGFVPFTALALEARGVPRAKSKTAGDLLSGVSLDPTAETVASFLKQLSGLSTAPNARMPLFVWHTNVTPGRAAPKRAVVQFHAIGSDRAIADAVVVRALTTLARDLYREEPAIRINSMGDKETRARYGRELGTFFKKRAATLPEECVACARRDTLEAAELVLKRACCDDLPSPTDHLSDASRKRLEDLLEFFEETETPYELAHDLISRGGAWSEICFEITVGGGRVAWGSRYSDLARRFFDAPMPATGGVLELAAGGKTVGKPGIMRPRFAFVHIGDEAKRLSIRLADDFKKARIPLTQNIGIESLTEQLALAERRNPSYLLIMGRKEALEGSALLRNRETQEEIALPIADLAERLKTFA